jgi:AraC-like DNA-binding protein
MLHVRIDPSRERRIIDFRRLKFRDVYVLGRYDYAFAHRPLEKHNHGSMIEICLQDEGIQPYRIEGVEYLLRGGDVLLTFPGETHGSGGAPVNRGRLYWMLIRMPGANERFLNLPPAESRELIRGLRSVASRHFRGRRALKGYLEKIFELHAAGDAVMRAAEIRNWALRFLLDVWADARRYAASRVSFQVKRVLDRIGAGDRPETPSVAQMAAIAGLSPPRFKARFKQETGFAPHHYLLRQKIESAKTALRSSHASLTDIGLNLGFSSSQYFATVFKRYTGQTPLQFRQGGKEGCIRFDTITS